MTSVYGEQLEVDARSAERETLEALTDWLTGLRSWNYRATLTFSGDLWVRRKPVAWLPSDQAAVRRAEAFCGRVKKATGRTVDVVAGVEHGTKYGRPHVEAVLCVPEPSEVVERAIEWAWDSRDGNGHMRLRRLKGPPRGAVRYSVKYAAKDGLVVFSDSLRPVGEALREVYG